LTPNPALNILELYHDCGPGGAERMILDLCGWLRTQGHRVTVATCREGWLAQNLRENGIETHVVAKRRLVDFRMVSEILRLAHERRVDVIHTHELPMMVEIAPAALLKGIALVGTLHGRENIAARRRRRMVCRLASRWCRRVVAVSGAMQRFLVEDVRIPRTKVQTIYNGIDISRYGGPDTPHHLRQVLGIPPESRVIGTVGSLYPVKGQTFLLQAMARVVRQAPDTVCLLVGRGELLPVLQREAADLGLTEQAKFLGFRTDIPELLSLMEIFVLPSLSEGLPLSLLEAQAVGKPAVATHVGGIPEVIEEGRTGYLVPPRRPDLLADRILRLLQDPPAARAMGERGRSRIREIFSLEAMAQGYLSLFESCLNGRLAHPARQQS